MQGVGSTAVREAISDAAGFWESSVTRVRVTSFERDRRAREECMHLHGTGSAACGMSSGEWYGPEAEGLIYVHHGDRRDEYASCCGG